MGSGDNRGGIRDTGVLGWRIIYLNKIPVGFNTIHYCVSNEEYRGFGIMPTGKSAINVSPYIMD